MNWKYLLSPVVVWHSG